jgi:hypothetical protein
MFQLHRSHHVRRPACTGSCALQLGQVRWPVIWHVPPSVTAAYRKRKYKAAPYMATPDLLAEPPKTKTGSVDDEWKLHPQSRHEWFRNDAGDFPAIVMGLNIFDEETAESFLDHVIEQFKSQRMCSPPTTAHMTITVAGNMSAERFRDVWGSTFCKRPDSQTVHVDDGLRGRSSLSWSRAAGPRFLDHLSEITPTVRSSSLTGVTLPCPLVARLRNCRPRHQCLMSEELRIRYPRCEPFGP